MGTHGIGMTSARTHARMVDRLREQGIRDEVVLSAMLAVPRHRFVDEALAIRAYDDVPLPIGHGQTISQPWVVARMTELARNGRELDGPVRERVGEALADPLTDVRVHADERADTLARSVSARAFTTGADIFFAHGEYRPRTASGDALLAHELTHVVQQRGSPTTGPLTVTDAGGALETEAEAMARELGDG